MGDKMNELLSNPGVLIALLGAAANYGAMTFALKAQGKRLDTQSGSINKTIADVAAVAGKIDRLVVRVDEAVKDIERIERGIETDRRLERERVMRQTHG